VTSNQYATSSVNQYNVNAPILGTDDDPIYQSENYKNADMEFRIPLTPGYYKVILHFAEIFFDAPDMRVFSVTVEGQQIVQNLDIHKASGGKFQAYVIQTEVDVQDGNLNIVLGKIIQNPSIGGIEILSAVSPTPAPSLPPVPTPAPVPSAPPDFSLRIACGQQIYEDTNGNNWVGSTPYLVRPAQVFTVTNPISGTVEDPIYQTENWRNGDLEYEIAVNPGPYEVVLHFAELWHQGPNRRVFSVTVEGQEVSPALDLYQVTGGRFIAHVIKKEVYVADGIMNIKLGQIVENPSLAGIEVHFLRNPRTLTGAPSASPSMSLQPSLSEEPSTFPTLSPAPTGEQPEPEWSGPYTLPLIAVAAANLPNGEILYWSAYERTNYGGSGKTYTAIFDPDTGLSSEALVQNTNHDMFCPGTSVLDDGRIMITGGSNSRTVTIYDPAYNSWSNGPDMSIGRGYHSQTVLSDGSVFTLGGSWSGGTGSKHGEVWTNIGVWQQKSGIKIPNTSTLLTADKQGVYRGDNHMWLFEAPDGRIFHAGPSRRMHWIDLAGNGVILQSVTRGNDSDSMCGNAVMYDIGKILTVGGAPDYNLAYGHSRAYIIDINQPNPVVTSTGDMEYPRSMASSVVLPSGEVVVVGGQEFVEIFTDFDAVMKAEVWNPATGAWKTLPTEMQIPRTYHSVAILMRDGRVWVGGGGLCGDCETNHLDAEILTPPYLIDQLSGQLKPRPVIQSVPASISPGDTISVTMNSSGNHTFALVKLSAITHSTNNDLRRVPLTVSGRGSLPNIFELNVPNSYSIVLPGAYWLFAIDTDGTPSIGETVYVSTPSALTQNAIVAETSQSNMQSSLQNSLFNSIQSIAEDSLVSPVVEGVCIQSKAMDDHCIGIKQGSQKDNALAIQWPCYGTENQKFDFHPQSEGGYRIVAEHSSKCLTVNSSGAIPLLGDPITQRICNSSGTDQVWTVEGDSSRQQIKEMVTGLCVIRPGTSLNPGTQLKLGLCGDGFNSLWSISDTSLVTKSFVPGLAGNSPSAQTPIKSLEFSGLCVSIADGSMDAGAPAIQDLCREDDDEMFSFQRVMDGIYRVVAVHSSMCLTVEHENGVSEEGAIVSQHPCTDDSHQLWRVTGRGGNQRLIPNHGMHSSDVPYCLNNIQRDDKAGNQLILWPCENIGARETWSISDALSPESNSS
jgi:galactose oxidase